MEQKPWWQSVTIWAVVFGLLHQVAKSHGYDIGDPSGWASQTVDFVAAGVALWGRLRATTKVTVTVPPVATSAILLAFLLHGCASSPATDAYNTKTAYHAAQEGWLAVCPGNGSGKYGFCHDPKVLDAVGKADDAAYFATQAYEQTALTLCPTFGSCKDGNNATALQTAAAAASATVTAFQQLLTALGVSK